ncbi:MAG: hypothetical protein AB8I08_28550 [Sandaracinaceae bacterium]
MTDLSSPFPAAWTVQRALDAYLEENGFGLKAYDDDWVSVTFWWLTFPFPNPASRKRAVRQHDLHHVATGYGTDPAGEFEISAWEVARGLRGLSLFVRGIVFSGYLAGLLLWPKRTRAAHRAGREDGPRETLFELAIDGEYPAVLAGTVGELRARLGLPEHGIAGARGLHGAAPAS